MKQKTFDRLQVIAHDYLTEGFYTIVNDDGSISIRVSGSDNIFEPHKNTSQAIQLAGHYNLVMGMERGTGSDAGMVAIVESTCVISRVKLDMTPDLGVGYEKALRKAIIKCVAQTINVNNEDCQ